MASKIGDIFIRKNIITQQQLDSALQEQKRTGEFLGKTLVQMGFVTEKELIEVLSEQFGIPSKNLKNIKIEPVVIEKIPAKFVWHYKFMPLQIKANLLTIAISNPLDMWSLDDIKLNLGYDVEPVLSCESEILENIKKYYGVGADTIEKILSQAPEKETDQQTAATEKEKGEDIEKLSEDASVIKLVNQLLSEAIKDRATDIHIEPYRGELVVRYRIDGILYDKKVPDDIKFLHSAIVSRIKIMSGLDIVEKRKPQDGRAKVKIGTDEWDLRVSILPTLYGENVVIRILPTKRLLGLEKLGLSEKDRKMIDELIAKPHGIIFVTGPTGSGKTTTLYTCLSKLNSSERKIITIEDPVEYELHGIAQIQVNPAVGLSFANALRSILRHDPDIVMVGEVRDFETSEITIQTALTGHLVFSTLHTNDAAGGITRLIDMGVEPFLIASSVEAFIAQRLVRMLCPKCKTKAPILSLRGSETDEAIFADMKISSDTLIYRGKGCDDCKHTGYQGRTAIYEILSITDEIRELIVAKSSSAVIKKKALEQGMHTLFKDGWEKVMQGLTTPEEVLKVTQITD